MVSSFKKSLILSTILFSKAILAQSPSAILGSAADLLQNILTQNQIRENALSPSIPEYTFPIGIDAKVAIDIQDYYFQKGELSMTGTSKVSNNSVFIMKGNASSLYGFLALHDSQKAYEYTTDNQGQVRVEEVSIAKIYPDLYGGKMRLPEVVASLSPEPPGMYSPMAQGQAIHIGKYKEQDLLKLESKPGSKKVFFLNTAAIMSGSDPLNAWTTKENMFITWQCVSDQFSMLDLNITTNRAVYTAAGVANSGIITYVNSTGRSSACVSCFGTTSAGTLYKETPGYNHGRTSSHEVGHEMGMSHDGGNPGGEYYEGIPAYQWCPIMGNYWFGNGWTNYLYQWSKGEYSGSNQKQDDFAQMTRYAPYVNDDIPTSKPLNYSSSGVITPLANFGQIGRASDSDTFTFGVTGTSSHLKLKIDRIEYLGHLDVDATLFDGSGKLVEHSNLPVNRNASFDLDLPAGNYSLMIKGGAEGTPANGFSNYSSMGYYAMEGTLTGGVPIRKYMGQVDRLVSALPNASYTALNLTIPNFAKVSKIALISISGQTVFISYNRVKSIDLSSLARGFYTFQLEADGESIQRMVTKL